MVVSQELLSFLSGVSLFENLGSDALEVLAKRGAELGFHRGDIICKKGDPGNSMFIIAEGIIEVFVDTDNGKQVLAHLRRGEYFGEMALLSGLPRSASVRSLADTKVFGLTKEDFEDVCRRNVDIALDIIKTLSWRLARSNVSATDKSRAEVFVLLSMEPSIGRTTLAANLATAMSKIDEELVALYDPNLENGDLARSFSCDKTIDIASALISAEHVEVISNLIEVLPNLALFPPQKRGGAVLQEFHHHIPFQALRENVSTVVVDSSSTIAGVNREIIKAAEGVLLLLPARERDLKARLEQYERMVLAPANVDLARVKLVLIKGQGEEEPEIPEDLGVETVVLPPLEDDGDLPLALLCEKRPDCDYAKRVSDLARKLRLGRTVELFVPITASMNVEGAKLAISEARSRCPELLHYSKACQTPPDGVDREQVVDVYMVLYGSASEAKLKGKMTSLLDCAGKIKEDLKLDELYLRLDGRLDKI